jgi:hypothetical protein
MADFWVTVGGTERVVGPVRAEAIARALRVGALPFDTWLRLVDGDAWHRLDAWLVEREVEPALADAQDGEPAEDDVTYLLDFELAEDTWAAQAANTVIEDDAPTRIDLPDLDFDEPEHFDSGVRSRNEPGQFDPRMRLVG